MTELVRLPQESSGYMGFELPSFAEMKGHAVSVMNFLSEQPDLRDKKLPLKFPIELRVIHSHHVFLINGSSGLIWKQGIPKSFVRAKDAEKPHNEDAWAFILVTVMRDPQKIGLQQLLFPQFSPYVQVVEIFVDWQDAVYNAVLPAASSEWSKNIMAASKDDSDAEPE